MVKKCERVFKCGSEQILEECGVASPHKKRQKTSGKQSAQPEDNPVEIRSDQVQVNENRDEYFEYGAAQ